jgi:hypothetical protein
MKVAIFAVDDSGAKYLDVFVDEASPIFHQRTFNNTFNSLMKITTPAAGRKMSEESL